MHTLEKYIILFSNSYPYKDCMNDVKNVAKTLPMLKYICLQPA
jgi:hypothetical protein